MNEFFVCVIVTKAYFMQVWASNFGLKFESNYNNISMLGDLKNEIQHIFYPQVYKKWVKNEQNAPH